ncbi:MAG TPA: glycosyltransferase [Nitrososphaera sp.]|nr:glycosyltransferase [Nitrososphaera sp.]
MNQRIAAVIPARNEANLIGRTLSAFFGQHTRPSRVIMVNDGATDRTADVAASTGAEVVDMPDRGATRMVRMTRERSPILNAIYGGYIQRANI